MSLFRYPSSVLLWFTEMLHLSPTTCSGAGVSKQSRLWSQRFRGTRLVLPWCRSQSFHPGKVEKVKSHQRTDNFKQVEKVQTPSWALCDCVCVRVSTASPPFPVIYQRLVAGGRTSYLNQSGFVGSGFLHLIFSLLPRSWWTVPVVVVWVSHSSR